MAVAGGAIAVCTLMLMARRPRPSVDATTQPVAAEVDPVVETLELSIPVLDSSSIRGDEQERILDADAIVVTTSLQKGTME